MTDPNPQPITDSVDEVTGSPGRDRIDRVFTLVSKTTIDRLPQTLEDRDAIVAGLLLCYSLAIGETINGAQILSVERGIQSVRDRGLINFQVRYQFPDAKPVDLGICVLQSRDPEIVNHACSLLLSYKDFGLDRLCILRSKEFNATTPDFFRAMPKLLSSYIGGSLVYLESSELASILTLLFMFHDREKYHLTTPEIREYFLRDRSLVDRQLMNKIIK
jgi:hypothetical protein